MMLEMALNEDSAGKSAASSQRQKLEDLKANIYSAMRGESLTCRPSELKRLMTMVADDLHKLDDWMERLMENRKVLLQARVAKLADNKAEDTKDKGKDKDKGKNQTDEDTISLKLPKPK